MYSKDTKEVKIIMEKFIITPKEDKNVTMTIRIDRTLQEKYNELSARTNRSRNELIGMALQFALDHMEIKEKNWIICFQYKKRIDFPHW